MTEIRYDKLVRDKIPDIITSVGQKAFTHRVTGIEYQDYLDKKLMEEVSEFILDHSREEICDVLEVLDAFVTHLGYDPEEIRQMKNRKAIKSGAFKEGIVLEKVEKSTS